MAYSSVAPGVGYKDPNDLNDQVYTPADSEFVAKTVAARLMEQGSRVSTVEDRLKALAVASGAAPGSPGDAAVAAYALVPESQTRAALDARYATTDRVGLVAADFGVKADGIANDTATPTSSRTC